MCLEPFLERGETVSVSDGGGELIPPLGDQTGELVLGPGTLERWELVVVLETGGGACSFYLHVWMGLREPRASVKEQ